MPEHDEVDIVCNVLSPKKQVSTGGSYLFLLTFLYSYIIPLDLNAQKKQIEHYLGEIQNASEPIKECDVLNRVASLLMQASAALNTVTTTEEIKPLNFVIKEKFAPAQKNEVQIPFKKTSKEPGRKNSPNN